MKKVLVIMEDDRPQRWNMGYDYRGAAGKDETKRIKEHARDIVSQLIVMTGPNVIEVTNLGQTISALASKGRGIGVALVFEQEPGSKNCLRCLEAIRAICGEKVAVIGVAQTVECMEKMEELKVWKLMAAPLGYIDIDKVLEAIREYGEK
jgi:hypothetical protein